MGERSDGGAIELPLMCGRVALVSRQDFLRLAGNCWRVGTNGYVYKRGARAKGVESLLHRVVTGAGSGQEVHHRDGNKLNCTRENLELTTPAAHQEHHKHLLVERSRARRKHPTHRACANCGCIFETHPDHRGSQIVCSKRCAIERAVAARKLYVSAAKIADAMIAERERR